MTKPQAVFFDFDGVVLESSEIKTEAFIELFNHCSSEDSQKIKTYHLENMGVSRYVKFEWIYKTIFNQPLAETKSKELGERFSDIVFKKILDAPFVIGAKETLQWVKENCLSFVASGTPQDELRKIVSKRDLNKYFDGVFGTPRSKTEIVNSILDEYSLDHRRCWFIGDASTDYQAAINTQLEFIARVTPTGAEYWKEQNVTKFYDLQPVLNHLDGN